MKPFFASLNLHEVHHLKNLLESAGIGCYLRNEGLSTLAGEVPFMECAAQLWLRNEADREAAQEILRHWRHPERLRQPPWTCGRCGERLEGQFTACWRCGFERPPGA